MQTPFAGTSECGGELVSPTQPVTIRKTNSSSALDMAAPEVFASTFPNPFVQSTRLHYRVETPSQISIGLYDAQGQQVKVLMNSKVEAGVYDINVDGSKLTKGVYFIQLSKNGGVKQTLRVVKN